MSDELQRTARAFGDNMAALFAHPDRPMLISTLAIIGAAVDVPLADLLSPDFDVSATSGRPLLTVVAGSVGAAT